MTKNTINTGIEKYLHTVSVLVQGAVLSPQSSVQNQRYHSLVEKNKKESLLYIYNYISII